jgi:GNAT superfamily N-acetyltransferase
VIEFRCFRNDDPPRLAEAWRAADLGPSAVQPMTVALLETAVFSKPYFDRAGLLVAMEDNRIVGFAHAAFGPTADRGAIDTSVGTTMLVVVVPHEQADAIGAGLLARSEDYLRQRGARVLRGGGTGTFCGFYLGLYGGASLPGILASSPGMQEVFRRAGYAVEERIAVLRRPLAGYRPPVNRLQLAIRRATVLRAIDEPVHRTWWEAATTAGLSLRRYELINEADELLGAATFWDMQTVAATWGVAATGLLHVEIAGPRRRQGLANYLVAEALHDLAQEGVALVEAHAAVDNDGAVGLFEKLGFTRSDEGTVFRSPPAP